MSTQTYDSALDFMPSGKASLLARAVRGIAMFATAVTEGQAANVRYTQLKARGLSHEKAAKILLNEHFGR